MTTHPHQYDAFAEFAKRPVHPGRSFYVIGVPFFARDARLFVHATLQNTQALIPPHRKTNAVWSGATLFDAL